MRSTDLSRGSGVSRSDRRAFLRMLGTGLTLFSAGGLSGCFHLTQRESYLGSTIPLPLLAQQFTNDELLLLLQDAKERWRNAFKLFLTIEENGITSGRIARLQNRIRDSRTHTVSALRELEDSFFEREINKSIELDAVSKFVEDTARETIAILSVSRTYSGADLFVHLAWSFSQNESLKRLALEEIRGASSSIITHLRKQIAEFKADPVIAELQASYGSSSALDVKAQARGNCLKLDLTSYTLIGAAAYLCDVRNGSLDCAAAKNLAQIATAAAIMGCSI